MDFPLLSSLVLSLGLLSSFPALLAQEKNDPGEPPFRRRPPPQPQPPPLFIPPPPPPGDHHLAPVRPPRGKSYHLAPVPPPSGKSYPFAPIPPPRGKSSHLAPVPPPRGKSSHSKGNRSGEFHKRKKHNLGKKVGLWFIGVAAGMQVCVVGFLVYKRRKLFKDRNL